MTKNTGRLALLFTLVGLIASIAAAYVHYHVLRDPGYTSFCDVNTTFSCTEVYQSRFGTFAGVPVAIIGVLYFVVTTLLVVGGLRSTSPARDHMPSYLFALSTIGLAVVFYLGYASFFVLKAVCLICLATYAGVIGLFITTGSASDVPMTRLPRLAAGDLGRLRRNPLALGVAVLAIAIAGAAVALFPHAGVASTVSAAAATTPPLANSEESAFEHWFSEQPRAALDVPRGDAKVLVVKFNDYQCPPCRHAYETYKSIYEKYASEHPGAVKLVYLDYPLDSSCNDNVLGGGPHPSACDAAVAVRLAEEKGKKPEMQQWLFDNQPSLSGASIREALKEIANVTNFDARYPEVIKLVKADIARGHQLGVHATPTFFIDGVRIEGALQPQYFDAAIAYELDHTKSGK